MSLVSQKLDNLLNGVSQRDERLRPPSQATEQINGLSDPSAGLRKRPPLEYVDLLDADGAAYDEAWGFTLDRDLDNKYRIVIRDGDLKVYDALTGESVEVRFPDGKGYLTGTGDFRAVAVDDVVYIVNRQTATDQLATTSPDLVEEALVWVRSGAEDTRYAVTVDSHNGQTTTATSSGDFQVDTKDIADDLKDSLEASSGFTSDFTCTVTGSTLHIVRQDGGSFELSVSDGLGDQGLSGIYRHVQRVEDLPPKGTDGFTVEVVGSPETEFDNYWVTYDDDEDSWVETVEPGSFISFDPNTMPHQLALKGALDTELISRGSLDDPEVNDSVGSSDTDSWDEKNGSSIGSGIYTLMDEGDYFDYFIPAGYVGEAKEYTANFAYNLDGLDPANGMTVNLDVFDDTDTLVLSLDNETYTGGTTGSDTLSGEYTASSGDYIRMEISFGSPPSGGEESSLIVGTSSTPHLEIREIGKQIDFGAETDYPGGFQVTVTLSGTDFNYTPTEDETGTDLALAFRPLIDADATFSASIPEDGKVDITGGDPTITFTFGLDETTDAWFNTDLSSASLVGTTVTNLTDGSTGTVTSTTYSGIRTGGLSGGSDNTFASGDLIQIGATGEYFSFSEVEWKDREAGDDDTNPFPDFLHHRITDISFYQGRLAFIYDDRVFFSVAGDATNFFRKTAKTLQADGPVGAESALPSVAAFDSAIMWNKALYLKAENGLVLVSGDPVLTPTTVRMDLVTQIQSSASLRPLVVGRSLFLSRKKENGAIQVHELIQDSIDVVFHRDVTLDVPTYLEGEPLQLAGSGALGILVVLPTECNTNSLYVYRFFDQGGERAQSSWSRWDLPSGGTILTADVIGGTLGLVIKYPDGVFLETMNLDDTVV